MLDNRECDRDRNSQTVFTVNYYPSIRRSVVPSYQQLENEGMGSQTARFQQSKLINQTNMGVFKKIKATVQVSKQLGQKYLEEYINFSSETKQLILKKKTVLLLCQQAITRVEKLQKLEPDTKEGLIATIEHKNILAKVHFTPEKITLQEDCVEGQLRLLNQTESLIYRYLIAAWKTFLGGKIPNGVLPEGVRIEGNLVYYSFPRNQAPLLDALFSSLEKGSVLTTDLKQGELTIQTSVAMNWKDFKVQSLLQLLAVKQK